MPSPVINSSITSAATPLMVFLKKKQENERFAQLIESSATFGLIILFVLFAIRPTVLTISTLYTEIESKKKLKEEIKVRIDNIVRAQQNFADFQNRSYLIDTTLPKQAEYSIAASQILGVFKKSEIPIENINFNLSPVLDENLQTKEKNLGVFEVPIQVKVDSAKLYKLLEDLKKVRRLLYFDSIAITSKIDTTTKKNTINLGLTPQFFYLKVPPVNKQKTKLNAK